MKKILALLFVICLSISLHAQEPAKTAKTEPATDQETKSEKSKVTRQVVIKNYCCPGCDFTSQKQGACPVHKKALIRDGMFYCEDGTTSRQPGKCADGKDMIKMIDRSEKRGEVRPVPSAK